MAQFYIAPDGTVDPAVTLVATGTTNYAKGWNTCAKWSDVFQGGGLYYGSAFDGTSDDVVNFYPGIYKLSAVTGGWPTGGFKTHNGGDTFQYLNFTGMWPNGLPGIANFVGSRTNPWPFDAVAAGANAGEDWMTYNWSGVLASSFSYIHWQNIDFIIHLGAENSDAPWMGTITVDHCFATNFEGGPGYCSGGFDGQHSNVITNSFFRGYTRGPSRTFGGHNYTDVVVDSEFQSTTRTGSAASTFGGNAFDAAPWGSGTTFPSSYTRVVSRNCAAGTSTSNYLQGDGQVNEENVGNVTTIDCYTEGNGDRGWDWKSPGNILRCVARGNGYGFGHHNDIATAYVEQSLLDTGFRDMDPAANGLTSACVQAVGATVVRKSVCKQLPTAAQVTALHAQAAGADFSIYDISVSPSSFQHDIYSTIRVGQLQLIDTYMLYNNTTGAKESHGAGSGDTGCWANVPIFGTASGTTFTKLSNNTAYTFKARGVDATGAAGPYGPTGTWTTGVVLNSGASSPYAPDLTKPTTPAAPTITGTTATSVSFTFTQVAQGSGVAYMGYLAFLKLAGDSQPILTVPGKSASPWTIYSLPPGAHTLYLAVYDSNGNVSDLSSGVGFTITNSPAGASLLAPLAPILATGVTTSSGTTLRHPSMVGLALQRISGGNPPVIGATYYEVADNSGTVYTRVFPTTSNFSTTITKTHVTTMTV